MVTVDAEGAAEMPGARAEGSEQYSQEQAMSAPNTTAMTEDSLEETMKVMDAVVERGNIVLVSLLDRYHRLKVAS